MCDSARGGESLQDAKRTGGFAAPHIEASPRDDISVPAAGSPTLVLPEARVGRFGRGEKTICASPPCRPLANVCVARAIEKSTKSKGDDRMASGAETNGVREAVGVFDTADALQETIDELQTSGFDRADISLMAGERAVEEKLGHAYQKASDVEDDDDVPRGAYISPESIGEAQGALVGGLGYIGAIGAAGLIVASGGTMAAALAAAAIAGGGGGLVGALFARLIGEHHAQYLQEQLDRGGILLWVRTRDGAHEKSAVDILTKHSGRDVHVHGVPDAPA
jgi:hypothetical protein